MYKFLLWIIIILISSAYYKKCKCKWYFNYRLINNKYNLVQLEFIYYDSKYNLKKGKLIVPKDSANSLIEILELCFLEKISL